MTPNKSAVGVQQWDVICVRDDDDDESVSGKYRFATVETRGKDGRIECVVLEKEVRDDLDEIEEESSSNIIFVETQETSYTRRRRDVRVFRFLFSNKEWIKIEYRIRTANTRRTYGWRRKRRRRRERTVVEVVVEMMRCCGDVFVAYHLASFSATRLACLACVLFPRGKKYSKISTSHFLPARRTHNNE